MEPWGNVRVSERAVQPARYLRKEFSIEKKISRATVYFSGLGLSELYLNGEKVGDSVLSPAFAQYDKRAFYVTYDVTKHLRRGANAIGAILGNGRFYADRSKVYSGTVSFGWPKLLLQLRVEYADGSVAEIVSDESWKLSHRRADSRQQRLRRRGIRRAQGISRLEPSRALTIQDWQPAQIVSAPGENISAQMIEPIRVTGTIKPVSSTKSKPGVFIFDMGQNMVGWCRLQVSGAAGTTVTLRHAETLKPDGTLYLANLRGAQATDTLHAARRRRWKLRSRVSSRTVFVTSKSPDFPASRRSIQSKAASSTTICRRRANLKFQIRCSTGFTMPSSGACAEITAASRPIARSATSARAGSATAPRNRAEKPICSTIGRFTRNGCRTWPTPNAPTAACRTSRPPTGRFIPTTSRGRAAASSFPKCCANSLPTRKSSRGITTARKSGWISWPAFVNNGIISRDNYGDWCVAAGRPDAHPFAGSEPASPTRPCSRPRIFITTAG